MSENLHGLLFSTKKTQTVFDWFAINHFPAWKFQVDIFGTIQVFNITIVIIIIIIDFSGVRI